MGMSRLDAQEQRCNSLSDHVERVVSIAALATDDVQECDQRLNELVHIVESLRDKLSSHQLTSGKAHSSLGPLRPEVFRDEMLSAQEQQCKSCSNHIGQQDCDGFELNALRLRLEELLPRIAEHDRCTRVVLCDVMPRLGELSDARDDVRQAILAIEERVRHMSLKWGG